jgi:hypothetical protein
VPYFPKLEGEDTEDSKDSNSKDDRTDLEKMNDEFDFFATDALDEAGANATYATGNPYTKWMSYWEVRRPSQSTHYTRRSSL